MEQIERIESLGSELLFIHICFIRIPYRNRDISEKAIGYLKLNISVGVQHGRGADSSVSFYQCHPEYIWHSILVKTKRSRKNYQRQASHSKNARR